MALALGVSIFGGALHAQESVEGGSRTVEFSTSCHQSVEAEFSRAVELLHSFEYPESESVFRSVLSTDPDCGLARWGVAMNRWHPLWALPSEADLATGSEMLSQIDVAILTEREAGYVAALKLFYSDTQSQPHQARAIAYRERMAHVYKDNLNDPEAAVFYALSILSTADPTDKTYANQFKAAALLNWVRSSQPHHPGVLHYIIHSYDYPGMAHLALDAATIYSDVAPDSAHAQHMPSHIFTRLGLWDRSIYSNHDSTASAADYTNRAQLPGHYDEGLHSIDYLMYALLQAARDVEAKQLLEDLRALGRANVQNFKVAYTHAATPARYVLERRQWSEATQLRLLPEDFPWREFDWARSIHHFARGIGAARSGSVDLARTELDEILKIRAGLSDTTLPYWREEVFVHHDALLSWIELDQGNAEVALELAKAAADTEDAVDKHPVTPGEVLPARELFADMLLELGRHDEALEQFQIVLAGSPNRANALLGAARAAALAGNRDSARDYYEALLDQSKSGNQDRTGLQEAHQYVGASD